jgi:aspartyl-tRNA(Asn)/glutamyl-tRNA(Gln) amidotransferase subunit C
MIDREQVLHVAKLARLELSEEEVGRMATELSGVLGHIEKIGVRPCLPREVALAQAPAVQDDGFLVPSPQAAA